MSQKGFTLIELVVTLAVLAIIASLAGPSFNELMSRSRVVSSADNLLDVLQYARAEAVRTQKKVTVEPTTTAESGNEWGNGITIWVDLDEDDTKDTNETVRVTQPTTTGKINVSGGSSFSFLASGLTNAAAEVTVNVCDLSGEVSGLQLKVLTSGMVTANNNYTCS